MNVKVKLFDNQEFNQKFIGDEVFLKKNSKYWIYSIIGGIGSGKSTVILNLLDKYLKKYYNHIMMISPTAKIDFKWKDVVEELEQDKHFYEKLTDEAMREITEKLDGYNRKHEAKDEKRKEQGKKPLPPARNLVILDDCIMQLPSSTQVKSPFNEFIITLRHHKCDCIITSQSFYRLNTNVRKNFSCISIFPTVNRKEIQAYLDELNISKEDFENYYQRVMTSADPHSFLSINMQNPKKAIFYENFNLLSSNKNENVFDGIKGRRTLQKGWESSKEKEKVAGKSSNIVNSAIKKV